jgi:hypothetical protein
MLLDLYIQIIVILRESKERKKTAASVTSSSSRSKKVKVLTHRPKRIETTEVLKLIERSASIPEPGHSMSVEVKTGPAEEPKLQKVAEQTKALSSPRDGIAEGIKIPCNNSEEEENGQRARRCHGIRKSINSCFC